MGECLRELNLGYQDIPLESSGGRVSMFLDVVYARIGTSLVWGRNGKEAKFGLMCKLCGLERLGEPLTLVHRVHHKLGTGDLCRLLGGKQGVVGFLSRGPSKQ